MTKSWMISFALLAVAFATPALGQFEPRSNATCGPGATGEFTPEGQSINFPKTMNCGENSAAAAEGASAWGADTRALEVNSTALGRGSQATATNATALGAGAVANHSNSTAVGTGAFTTAPNQVSLGGGGSSVRIGDIAASRAAQVGPVGLLTVDTSGTLGRNTAIVPAINMLESGVTTLFDLREVDRRDSRQGIAAAMVMGAAPFPSSPGRTSYVLNAATFRGEQAIGGSILHRLDSDAAMAVGVGFSYAGNRNNGARVGIAGEF